MAIEEATATGRRPPRTRQLETGEPGPIRRSYLTSQRKHAVGPDVLARSLGWFSIGLGLAELIAPRALTRIAGISRDHVGLTRLCGLRELATGIGILRSSNPRPWVKARVAGDVMDLATLGVALFPSRNHRGRTLAAIGAVAGVTALDLLASRELSPELDEAKGAFRYGVPVITTLMVNKSPEECYSFWRELSNLPRFMRHLESVSVVDERRSHWVAKAPAGTKVEWDAEITEDRPNALLAWRSLPGSQIPNAGTVRFEKAAPGRGTVIVVSLQYDPPLGKAGAMIAKLFGEEPQQQVREDLRRFKQLLETGEIPTTHGQPAGRRSAIARMFGKGETP